MTHGKKPQLRSELKYLIDPLQYAVLQRKLLKILKPDPNMGPNRKYTVRNLYFDDFKEAAFFEKHAGISDRRKYRIRIYNGSDAVIKFERKTKISQFILKESVRITREEADKIVSGNLDFLANSQNPVLRDFYFETRCNLMRPAIIIEYDREAYTHTVGNLRVTFDTGLRIGMVFPAFFGKTISTMTVLDSQDIIMEIKYNEVIPKHVCGLFPNTIKPRLAIGKFALGRAQQKSVIGDLPIMAKFW